MFIQLTVTLSLIVQVCSAAYDVSYARLTANEETKVTRFLASAIFSNGDLLVGGFTAGLASFPSAGSNDFLLQRYSYTGSLLWTKVFGAAGSDSIQSVAVDASDNIYAAGYIRSTPDLIADVYIAKFDSSGNTIFSSQVGGTLTDSGEAIGVDNARGVFFIAGYTQSAVFNGVATVSTSTNNGFLLQLDSSTGAILSTSVHGVAASGFLFSGLAMDSAGAVWVSGRTNAPTYYGKTIKGSVDLVVQKFSSSGATLFADLLGSTGHDQATGIATDSSDNVYISGWVQAPIDGAPVIGSLDILMTKYNSAGTKLWTKLVGSPGFDSSYTIAVDSTLGQIYVSGYLQTATFYGDTTPGSTIYTPYLLVLSSADGSYVSSKLYPATGGGASTNSIAIRGPMMYVAGNTGATSFQGQTKTGGTNIDAGFVMKLGDGTLSVANPTIAPTIAATAVPTTSAPTTDPTVSPTYVPTASPTAVCMQWTLGDYGESCSATCSKLTRTCKDKYLKEIVTQEAFYAIVGSAVNSRTGGAVGTAETFCSLTPESIVTVGAPAALSVVLSSEDHHSPVRTSCSYPASAAEVTVGCDDVLPLHNYRRFCPCLDHNCDGAWYLGYSGDSCDATCTSAGGVCDAEPLSAIVNPEAFSAMVASATVVETNELIGESSAAFCHEGINILPLAPAPSVITLTFGAVNETLCAYPTSESNLQGSCDMAFTDLPAQRFCNCKVTGPASHQHRMLLAPAAVTAPEPAAAVQTTPHLRGKATTPLVV